jgi:hypothetical protein
MTTLQKLSWAYAALFFFIVLSGHVPGLTTDQGLLLGGFNIDLIDDALHTFSGLWAAYAAWKSPAAAQFYFRAFGIFYTFDAFLGFFTGYATTDIVRGNWGANSMYSIYDVGENLALNLPHFIIGPLALLIGFYFYKTLDEKSSNKKQKKAR